MVVTQDLASLAGNTVTGQDGTNIGKIVDVYESTDGADGTFVTVSTGMFGGHATASRSPRPRCRATTSSCPTART